MRVIAATNQDLAEKVRQGTFRQDLYFRINVVRLELPPLRDRLDDLPLLAEHFLKTFTCVFGKSIRAFSDDVFALFLRYDWPGNVRQLEHVIEHACILCRSDVITVDDLPQDLRSDVRAITASPVQPAPPLISALMKPSPWPVETKAGQHVCSVSAAARCTGACQANLSQRCVCCCVTCHM